MNDTKPKVFPTQEEKIAADERAKIAAYEAEKTKVTSEIYANPELTKEQIDAVTVMRQRTENQIKLREEYGVVKHPELGVESILPYRTAV